MINQFIIRKNLYHKVGTLERKSINKDKEKLGFCFENMRVKLSFERKALEVNSYLAPSQNSHTYK